MAKEEYYILNVLRGMGALFVLFYHFFVFFFAHQVFSAKLLQVEPVTLSDPFYLQTLNSFPLDIGHLGVAFFFLISGFLIQPSLERYSTFKSYLVHKVFRLWPSYLLCFPIGILCVAAFYLSRGSAFPYSSDHLFACLFWVRDLFHYPYIDGSVWSLEVQLKFYLFAGIIWSFWKKNFLEKMIYLTLSLSIGVYTLFSLFAGEELSWFYLVIMARKNLKYFLLILLGTCLYSFYKKQISGKKAVAFCSIMLACFVSPLFSSPDFAKTVSYLSGFFIFSYFLLFPVKNMGSEGVFRKFINWVSQISYPIYIGHVLPGYALMYFMIEQGISVYVGIFSALIYVFLMAEFVHKKIEISFIKMSSKFFNMKEKAPLPVR